MNKYSVYVIIIGLVLGVIVGINNHNHSLPVTGGNSSPFYYGIRGQNYIALTFNVDWGQQYIPGILQVLEDNNLKATFFLTGHWAKRFPELVRQISDSGQEIGNHGYRHQHPLQLSDLQLQELIIKNEEVLHQITGKRTDLFAPPYGEVDDRVCNIACGLGYQVIMWSADTIDWQRPSPLIIEQRAVNKIEDGGIILMHPTEPSLRALPGIISTLKRRGFNFVSISKLIGKDDVNEN